MQVVTIGRGSDNDIIIKDDTTVTRVVHCQIALHDDGRFTLADNSSKNGTFVNGRKIVGEVLLKPTDIIRIGNTTLPWRTYFNIDDSSHSTNPPVSIPPQVQHSPLIAVPENINLNQNVKQESVHANVAKRGDDFKVPFFSNMGHIVGNTMGCLVSALIIIGILVVVGLIIANLN